MNPLAALTLTYFPLLALFVFAGSLILRFAFKAQAQTQAQQSLACQQRRIVIDVALLFGLLGVMLLHLVAALYTAFPRLFPPTLLGFCEVFFLAAWAGVVLGALGNAFLRVKAWRAGDATQVRPASYYALLALTGLSGMGMAICCRWTITWLGSAWKSWWVSLLGSDLPGLLFVMPLAVPVCLLLVVCCCVVWPASGLSLGEVFPFRSVLKRLRQNAATTSLGA